MARKKTFNSPLRKVFKDSNNQKCYQFEGLDGYWASDRKTPAKLPIIRNFWQIYGNFFVVNKRTGEVTERKVILDFDSFTEAEKKFVQLQKTSKELSQNKNKILTINGFNIWLHSVANADDLRQLFTKSRSDEIDKITAASNCLSIIYRPNQFIKTIKADIYNLTYRKLRTIKRSTILLKYPKMNKILTSKNEYLTETEIKSIIKYLNKLFKKAYECYLIDFKLKAIYRPKSINLNTRGHSESNTLTKSEREIFFRFQVMLNEYFRNVPIEKLNFRERSANFISLLKEASCQRHPFFNQVTIDLMLFREKIEFSRFSLDFEDEDTEKHYTLLLVPKELMGTDKEYKNIVVPASIEKDLYNFCEHKIKRYQKNNFTENPPLIFSRNYTGEKMNKEDCDITNGMMNRYFEKTQNLLNFNGKMTPHSLKDNFFKRAIFDGSLKQAMKKVGNKNISIVKEHYLPTKLKTGHVINHAELIEAISLADEFDQAYVRALKRGMEGIGKKAKKFFELFNKYQGVRR